MSERIGAERCLWIAVSNQASDGCAPGMLLVVAICDVVDSDDGIGCVAWPRIGLVVGCYVGGCWYASYAGSLRL